MESESTVPPTKPNSGYSSAVNPGASLSDILSLLTDHGFEFVESLLAGSSTGQLGSINRTTNYFNRPVKEGEQAILRDKLNVWIEVLSASDSPDELLDIANRKAAQAEESLRKNLLTTLDATRELETNYRALSLFYTNAETPEISNVSVVSADLEQVCDLENSQFIDHIANELRQNYDRLDLRDNYSLLVIPGFMRSNIVLEKWAKIAYANKVMLFTDFADVDGPDDVLDLSGTVNMSGAELYRSNVIMTCNWVVGRSKVAEVGELEHLFIPPSAALAGKTYCTLMSQVSAGKQYGGISDVLGVRFRLWKNEVSVMERLNLVPMIDEHGRVMAYGSKTLFNGPNIGLQTSTVVRVFDYIVKVLFDFLNRRAFENWNTLIEGDLRRQIADFLDSVKGPAKLIEQFRIVRLERDSKVKDRVYLDIRLTPYYPAKSFIVRLDGRRADATESPEWTSNYELV
ncbi:type VI secretion system contractile sheath protein TssC [Spirosoma pulveris]